ncbi:hypothetical protein ES708_13599 [subsurface metagenome]
MRLTISLIIILFIGTLSCSKEDDQYKIYDGFNIYLLKDENVTAYKTSEQEISNLELQIRPWVSSDDIEYYDYSTHILYLNHELLISDNAASDISVYGKPFVVIVNGERQYLGAIWPGFSSSMFFGPVINVAPRVYPDDIIHISLEQYSFQQSQDLRENDEIRYALINTSKYHAGLECTVDTIEILDNNQENNTCTLKYTYTIRNNDIFNLLIFDPDKMGSGLFHYFTNGVYLRNENNLYQSTTGHTSPDPWNSWELNWLSLILSGDSITKTVIKTGYPFIPSGSYDCYFRFPTLSHQLSKEERILPDGRIWIGKLHVMKSFDIQF